MPKQPVRPDWRPLADSQAGLITRRQLNDLGLDRFFVRNQVAAGRWVERTSTVIGTTTGALSREATMWLGVLHAGPAAIIGGLTAGEVLGLRNWHRDDITVLVPDELEFSEDEVAGVAFIRTRRDLVAMRLPREGLPVCRIEPAVLLWAAYQKSRRSAQGVVAAVMQQRLSSVDRFADWLGRMRPLRWAPLFRGVLADIQGGAQSLAEIDIRRMCRRLGIAAPTRQRKRVDSAGRVRFTDCEWVLPNDHVVILEIDGGFHMEVEHWEDDLARQRRISGPGRTVVRCTSREVRDDYVLGADLVALGVPRRAPRRAV